MLGPRFSTPIAKSHSFKLFASNVKTNSKDDNYDVECKNFEIECKKNLVEEFELPEEQYNDQEMAYVNQSVQDPDLHDINEDGTLKFYDNIIKKTEERLEKISKKTLNIEKTRRRFTRHNTPSKMSIAGTPARINHNKIDLYEDKKENTLVRSQTNPFLGCGSLLYGKPNPKFFNQQRKSMINQQSRKSVGNQSQNFQVNRDNNKPANAGRNQPAMIDRKPTENYLSGYLNHNNINLRDDLKENLKSGCKKRFSGVNSQIAFNANTVQNTNNWYGGQPDADNREKIGSIKKHNI